MDSPDKIYLWIQKKIKQDLSINMYFIDNVFQYDLHVDRDYFQKCIKNTFDLTVDLSKYNLIDKNTAYSILSQLDYKYMIEPLMFRYVNDGFINFQVNYDPLKKAKQDVEYKNISDYLPLTLGFFDSTMIHMITGDDDNKLYFPLNMRIQKFDELEKFVHQIDKIEEKVIGHELTHKFIQK